MKIWIIFCMFILLVGMVSADKVCDYVTNDLRAQVNTELPSFLPYANERFNAITGDDTIVGSVVIVDGVITEVNCDSNVDSPTYVVYVKDVGTLKDIATSESPADALDSAMTSGAIDITGQTTGKKIKGFFTRVGVKLASWFT